MKNLALGVAVLVLAGCSNGNSIDKQISEQNRGKL